MRLPMSKVVLAGVLCLAVAGGCASNASARPAPRAQIATETDVANVQAAGARPVGNTRAATAAAPYCGITWGSTAKIRTPMSTAPMIAVASSRHSCWDRVVFEFDGAVAGYSVRYVNSVLTDGEGVNLSPYTAGGAWLEVVLRAPAYDESGATFDARTGDHPVNVLRSRTLRDVVFGGSFEGSTTFAVGVRARLPFRVSIVAGPGSHSRIIIDVAHRWQQ